MPNYIVACKTPANEKRYYTGGMIGQALATSSDDPEQGHVAGSLKFAFYLANALNSVGMADNPVWRVESTLAKPDFPEITVDADGGICAKAESSD